LLRAAVSRGRFRHVFKGISMKPLQRGTRYRAFTLVELLVVIGIIAVLIGMLMPALGAARNQSRSVQCKSNLHQIAVGCLMYAQEYKVWIGFTAGIDRKVLLYPYLQQGQNNTDLNQRDVWWCPANVRPEESASYGFNTNLNYKKFSLLKKWPETVTIGDAGINDLKEPITATHMYPPSAQPGASGAPAAATIGRPNPRHPNKTVSVGFVDGHVEGRKMAENEPFYPGEPGAWTGNNIKEAGDPNYKDTLWDLN
jgi:prepilin-type processing-associated H-X9-DG protein/prepilin-type N-terminal cleavage/methylation domain-containing protein